ncbi:MAG: hypothetical protein JW983_07380 [Elusimicrobia bacterium]|nr:hypothetical protein [Elusimicrobiota bacterium]
MRISIVFLMVIILFGSVWGGMPIVLNSNEYKVEYDYGYKLDIKYIDTDNPGKAELIKLDLTTSKGKYKAPDSLLKKLSKTERPSAAFVIIKPYVLPTIVFLNYDYDNEKYTENKIYIDKGWTFIRYDKNP